jgi:hypothetical protein
MWSRSCRAATACKSIAAGSISKTLWLRSALHLPQGRSDRSRAFYHVHHPRLTFTVFMQPISLPFAMPGSMKPPPLMQNTEIYAPRVNSTQPSFYSLFHPPPCHNSAYDRHFVGERRAGLGTSINAARREAQRPSR